MFDICTIMIQNFSVTPKKSLLSLCSHPPFLHSFSFARISWIENHAICSLLWLLSFSIMFLRLIDVVCLILWAVPSFLLLYSIPLYVASCAYLLTRWGHSGCFQLLNFKNRASLNICVLGFVWINGFISLE